MAADRPVPAAGSNAPTVGERYAKAFAACAAWRAEWIDTAEAIEYYHAQRRAVLDGMRTAADAGPATVKLQAKLHAGAMHGVPEPTLPPPPPEAADLHALGIAYAKERLARRNGS